MGVRRTDLASGAVVVSERMPGARSASFGLYFPTGSRYETPANNGISHFIEHLIFKGTRSRSPEDVNREIDLLGGVSNAYTSKETLCMHSRVLPEHLSRLIALFGDLASHALPEGSEAEVERERQVVLSEISSVEDSPEDLVGDLCDRAYFGDHPLGLPVVGNERAVARLALPEIRDHFSRHIVARNMVVSAAGDVDHELLLAQVAEHLADLPTGGEPPSRTPPEPRAESHVLERDLEQVQVCLSARGVTRSDQRRRVAELLSVIVGEGYSSRLFREVRERHGLAYSVFSSLHGYLDAGSLNVYLAVSPEKLHRALELVGNVLHEIRAGRIESDELEAAREHLRASTVLSHEHAGSRVGFMAEQVLLGDANLELDSELEEIQAIRLDEVRTLARELLSTPLAVAAVGPVRADALPTDGWEIPA